MGALSRYRTFIFDWDGTLRSVSIARKINARVNPNWRRKKLAVHVRHESHTITEIEAGLGHVHTNKTLAELRNAESEFMAFVADLSLKFITPRLGYGARPLLEKLTERGSSVALYTDAALWRAYRELDYLKVMHYFDAILSAQSLHRLKPDPLGLEVLMKALGARRATTLYVGDMKDDVKAARNAGITSCVVTNGFDSADMLKAVDPDYMFSSLEELAKEL